MNLRTATLRPGRQRIYGPTPGRRHTYRSKAVSKRTAWFRFSRLEMAGLVTACVLFSMGLWTSYEIHRIAGDITQFKTENVILQDTRSRLEKQHKKLLGTEYLAPIGKKIGLHPPEAGQVVTLN